MNDSEFKQLVTWRKSGFFPRLGTTTEYIKSVSVLYVEIEAGVFPWNARDRQHALALRNFLEIYQFEFVVIAGWFVVPTLLFSVSEEELFFTGLSIPRTNFSLACNVNGEDIMDLIPFFEATAFRLNLSLSPPTENHNQAIILGNENQHDIREFLGAIRALYTLEISGLVDVENCFLSEFESVLPKVQNLNIEFVEEGLNKKVVIDWILYMYEQTEYSKVLNVGIRKKDESYVDLIDSVPTVSGIAKYNRWLCNVNESIATRATIALRQRRIMFVGREQSGKTSLIRNLTGKLFNSEYIPTVVSEIMSVYAEDSTNWMEVNNFDQVILKNDFYYYSRKMSDDLPVIKTNFPSFGSNIRRNDGMYLSGKYEEIRDTRIIRSLKKRFLKRGSFKDGPQPSVAYLGANSPEIQRNCATYTFWDVADQHMFQMLHHLFLATQGIYVIVFNLVNLETNPKDEIEVLDSWLKTIDFHSNVAPVFLVGTHADIHSAEYAKVNEHIGKLFDKFQSLSIVNNVLDGLYFFPVDNTSQQGSSSNLRNMIDRFVATDTRNSAHHVPLLWVLFFNFLMINKSKPYLSMTKVLKNAAKFNISAIEVVEIIKYYIENGSLAYCSNINAETNDSSESFDIAVINPQWVLDAMKSVIYHKADRSSKVIDKKFDTHVLLYQEHALLNKELLFNVFWAKYSMPEKKGLLKLATDSLIMSKYIFNFSLTNVEPHKDANYYFLPLMLPDSDEELTISSNKNSQTVYVQCVSSLCSILYQHMVCLFLRRSGEIEGSYAPILKQKSSQFWFRDTWITLFNESFSGNKIRIVIQAEGIIQTTDICQYCVSTLQSLSKTVSKNTEIATLHYTDISLKHSEENFLDPARILSDTESSNDFEEAQTMKPNSKSYSFFLAHEWGTEKDGFRAHSIVRDIAFELEVAGHSVWFDDRKMKPDGLSVIQAIRESEKILVFITERYINRCKDESNHCAIELHNALSVAGKKKLIPVILDSSSLNHKSWSGLVSQILNDHIYYDFTTPEKRKENLVLLSSALDIEGELL